MRIYNACYCFFVATLGLVFIEHTITPDNFLVFSGLDSAQNSVLTSVRVLSFFLFSEIFLVLSVSQTPGACSTQTEVCGILRKHF